METTAGRVSPTLEKMVSETSPWPDLEFELLGRCLPGRPYSSGPPRRGLDHDAVLLSRHCISAQAKAIPE